MNKTIARIMAVILALLMVGSAAAQLMTAMAKAAMVGTISQLDITDITYRDNANTTVTGLRSGDKVNITLSYFHKDSTQLTATDNGAEKDSFSIDRTVLGTGFSTNANSKMKVSVTDYDMTTSTAKIVIYISNVEYKAAGQRVIIKPTTVRLDSGTDYDIDLGVDIPVGYFGSTPPDNTSGGDDDGDGTYTPDLVIESVWARDKDGKIIEKVTEDTPAFTLEVVYTDRGFTYEEEDEFTDDTTFAYLTDPGDLVPLGTTRGALKRIATPSGDPPRFRATFENITYPGGSGNFAAFEFRVQYIVYGYDITGTGKGRLYSVDNESSDDDEVDPPTPYIIIDSYSLGDAQIEAGSTFTLAMVFKNTSKEIPLENIRLMVNPVTEGTTEQSFLSIASETNTYYYETLGAAGTGDQAVEILVKATATVGSQALKVDFTYEYVVESGGGGSGGGSGEGSSGSGGTKVRKSGETSTTIYIPITQIDRFTVDPITDYQGWIELGQEGYVTVSFVNRGKSTTYNVSGYLVDAEGNQAQTEHHGNLEAGASASLEFSVAPSEVGEYNGTIIIMYEDENGEEKEVPVTFTTFVEEPYYDPGPIYPEDPGLMEPEEPGTPWWKYALFIGGGLAIAVPLALYLAKRVLAKGNEDFDEDF